MVDALRNLHRSLRPGGTLLDVHAEPENSRLEVWSPEGIHELGEIEQDQDAMEILAGRSCLAHLEDAGLYRGGREEHFEMLGHYRAVDDWLHRWAAEGWNFFVADTVLTEARELLAGEGEQLVIREMVRAKVLTRVP